MSDAAQEAAGPSQETVAAIARVVAPALFTDARGRPLTAPAEHDLAAQAEACWWVSRTLAAAEEVGAVRHGTLAGDDVAADTLVLIREALASRGLWEAVAVVTELERPVERDAAGRWVVDPPTGTLRAVSPPGVVGEADHLAARRAAREWQRDSRP